MMRLGRASAIVALSLLTLAATAHAECAWVLWRHTAAGPEGLSQVMTEDWDPMRADESRAACQRMVVRLAPSGSVRLLLQHRLRQRTANLVRPRWSASRCLQLQILVGCGIRVAGD